jgi:GntR family transcriptional regulator, transcriptional repressor for pyruvate dehydrogenase complex
MIAGMAGPLGVEAIWERALFAPVPVRNTFEVTVERLAQGIRLGVLTDGEQLPPERSLAEMLAVSRVTLREAIGALREAGLVESRRGRGGGTFVVSPTRNNANRVLPPIDDTLDLRRVVEPGCAALAASRPISAEDRRTLQRCLEQSNGAGPDQRRLADARLHLAIAAVGGSASVTALVADIHLKLDALLRAIPVIPANIAHSDRQHDDIVQAVLDADTEAARCRMEEHVDGTAALLRGFLD